MDDQDKLIDYDSQGEERYSIQILQIFDSLITKYGCFFFFFFFFFVYFFYNLLFYPIARPRLLILKKKKGIMNMNYGTLW